MSNLIFEARGLNQSYGQSQTLWNMDLELPKGECTVVMGRNGVGKTTLLKTLMGLLPFEAETFAYQGESIVKRAAEERARMGIGYVPQGRQIFPLLTVRDNLRIGLPARADKSKHVPEFIFELFPVLKEMLDRRGGDLSGGQQQQLAIGRALVTDPQLLILDEPTEGIQPNVVSDIGRIIRQLVESPDLGLTVLIVEQKLPFARKVGDRFCIMDRGRAVAKGTLPELTDELVAQHLTV